MDAEYAPGDIFEFDVESESGSSDFLQFLTFYVAQNLYAVEILETHEILKPTLLTRLPNAAPEVLGVMNLRGNIIPVVDLCKKFTGVYAPVEESTRIIVITVNGRYTGLMVHRISEVARITEDSLEGTEMRHMSNQYVRAVGRSGEHIFLILNLEQLCSTGD